MKYHFIVIAFLLVSVTGFAQDSKVSLNWLTNLEEAKKASKDQDKPILMYFTGSDWCSPCKMLDEDFFCSLEFQEKVNNVILLMIDSPYRIDIISEKQMVYNKKIISKYNKDEFFPKIISLNHRGKILDEIKGYSTLRDTSHYFTFLQKQISEYR